MSRDDTYENKRYSPREQFVRDTYAYNDTRIGGGTPDPNNTPVLEDYYTLEAMNRFLTEEAYRTNDGGR